ncbi:hypothetical protein AA313_de0204033 [Arthrobotrys entomopaga]|nr:hypothetical protein AA313_de0204033 [Arthrobotrys entomopaga]
MFACFKTDERRMKGEKSRSSRYFARFPALPILMPRCAIRRYDARYHTREAFDGHFYSRFYFIFFNCGFYLHLVRLWEAYLKALTIRMVFFSCIEASLRAAETSSTKMHNGFPSQFLLAGRTDGKEGLCAPSFLSRTLKSPKTPRYAYMPAPKEERKKRDEKERTRIDQLNFLLFEYSFLFCAGLGLLYQCLLYCKLAILHSFVTSSCKEKGRVR